MGAALSAFGDRTAADLFCGDGLRKDVSLEAGNTFTRSGGPGHSHLLSRRHFSLRLPLRRGEGHLAIDAGSLPARSALQSSAFQHKYAADLGESQAGFGKQPRVLAA